MNSYCRYLYSISFYIKVVVDEVFWLKYNEFNLNQISYSIVSFIALMYIILHTCIIVFLTRWINFQNHDNLKQSKIDFVITLRWFTIFIIFYWLFVVFTCIIKVSIFKEISNILLPYRTMIYDINLIINSIYFGAGLLGKVLIGNVLSIIS